MNSKDTYIEPCSQHLSMVLLDLQSFDINVGYCHRTNKAMNKTPELV